MRIQDIGWLCPFCGEIEYCKTKILDVEREPKVNSRGTEKQIIYANKGYFGDKRIICS
jgi:hypothetical protein